MVLFRRATLAGTTLPELSISISTPVPLLLVTWLFETNAVPPAPESV